ncbi:MULTISPECIES: DUF4754 family protein [Yersinia]|uniref:DUF4754 family protein n=1 Tax=Yersinia TaxID=629 RepID=UPI001C610AC7|nr:MULTISPECIES: DUF4754 family protein [Yersinia]EKN4770582.1 DUF4754 family protein [Yersinia enterocolitica]EKN5995858.1 DUF4754 domain-containing protein [Yersinia enterocolitica]MBW5820355.1 DUF4754 family protein [Yersinia enterocolitica]MBW5826478.1 DUF4754 family protein [Yersinia kristensenii]HEI6816847.1 DUF4754 family protein [Yersinia enterocolitica]
MNKPYKQIINDLLERHNFALYTKGHAAEPIATESLIQGLQALRTAAFFAEDIDTFQEISLLVIRIENGDSVHPFDIAVAA